MKISVYFILFIFYSCFGWIYESIFCSYFTEKKFINRGFLTGPYCPIYGVGAVLCTAVFDETNSTNIFIIFIACAVGSCIIEYVTSFVMEKLFNTRWWDYSSLPFNLNGRICLYGALVFGLAGTVIALVNPYAERVFDFIDNKFIDRVAVLIFIAMAADFTMTIMSWRNLNISLMKIHNILNEKLEKTMEGVSQKAILIEEKYKDGIVVYGKSLNKLLSIPIKKREMRFLKAFPGLKPIKYSAVVDRIREEIIKHKNNLSS